MEEVVFQDSLDDWVYVWRYVQHRTLRWWICICFAWVGFLFGIGLINIQPKNGAGWIMATLSVLLMGLTFRAKPIFTRGEIGLTLDDEKLRFRAPAADCTYTRLERVIRTKRLLIMYLTPYAAVLLPFRACRDVAQYERIEQLARGLVKK